jgi:dipeptidyl aminopeptidase/acylaminoacyl peptidase
VPPLSASEVFAPARSFSWIRRDGDAVLWVEARPAEGRSALVRWAEGEVVDLTPAGQSCSNGVGYGATPYCVLPDGEVLACDGKDQRVHSLRRGLPLTPPSEGKAVRWGDFVASGEHLYAVRETHHDDGRIDNELVRVSLDGSFDAVVLDGGHDFVGAPRVSPDGRRLAWISWDHPQMPWDGAELWVADLTPDGVGSPVLVAGSATESVMEPTWAPDGDLLFLSDRSGWWNLYRAGDPEPVVAMAAEMGDPLWMLGARTFDVFADGRLLVRWTVDGFEHLGVRHLDGRVEEIATPYASFRSPTVVGERVAVIAGGPRHAPVVTLLDPVVGGTGEVLRTNGVTSPEVVSVPEPITFPTTDGAIAHGFWFPPSVPTDGPVPLIVNGHGGPTSAVVPVLDLKVQYWTSRGYGYVEVNHRGSTGHGRAYRDALKGQWGVADVDDAVAATQHLVGRGLVDPAKLVVRGISAGGWLTLCCLAFRDVFATGGSMNGVSDAMLLATETHKFESRYLDSLIGPLPEAKALYEERSPSSAADRIAVPMILLQGADDEVVPPNQAQLIADALSANGIEHEHHVYEGEGHLFAKAENLVHALETETAFYARVLDRSPS